MPTVYVYLKQGWGLAAVASGPQLATGWYESLCRRGAARERIADEFLGANQAGLDEPRIG